MRAFLASLSCVALNASATTFYVAPSGADCADCGTSARPFLTIQKAADLVNPGDTVMVRAGVYPAPVNSKRGGNASARVRFVSAEEWKAVLQTRGQTSIWNNTADYITIENFEITGDARYGILNYGSHTKMLGNHIHHLGHRDCIPLPQLGFAIGIDHAGASRPRGQNRFATDNDTIGNSIHDISSHCSLSTGGNGGYAIYHAYGDGLIANNVIYRCRQVGIHLWHLPEGVRVTNNTIFSVGTSAVVAGGQSNNGTARNLTFQNNILYDNGSYGFKLMGLYEPGTIRFTNNLVYKNRTAGFNPASAGLESGNLALEPQFVSYSPTGSGNYRLKASSPAINAGALVTEPGLRFDFDGLARLVGGRPDIGAFEFGSTPSRKPSAPRNLTVR